VQRRAIERDRRERQTLSMKRKGGSSQRGGGRGGGRAGHRGGGGGGGGRGGGRVGRGRSSDQQARSNGVSKRGRSHHGTTQPDYGKLPAGMVHSFLASKSHVSLCSDIIG
jgi:hypothetical protein